MRLLADVGASRATAEELRRHGYDVLHLSEAGLHRLSDAEILDLARQEGRTIVAFDLDFGDLLAAGSHPLPSVILCRLRDPTPRAVTPRVLEVLTHRKEELQSGALILIEDRRYRVRRLPIQR